VKWKLLVGWGSAVVFGWIVVEALMTGDRVVSAARRSLVIGVPTEGMLRSVDTVEIKPPQVDRISNFQIERIKPEGTEVEKGEPILVFDTSDLKRRLELAATQAATAATELEKTSTDLEIEQNQLSLALEEAKGRHRRATLAARTDQQVIARTESQKAALDLLLAEEEMRFLEQSIVQQGIKSARTVERLQGEISYQEQRERHLREAIELMTVRAPKAGTVVIAGNSKGEKHQVGDRTWRMQKILELPNLGLMEAIAEVDEAAAGRLAIGQLVTLRLDSYAEKEYTGRIAMIRRVVQRRSAQDQAKVVRLTVSLESTDALRMRPGMRFRGVIATDVLQNVLTLPRSAVKSDKMGAFVIVKTLLGRRKVYPELGQSNRDFIEVVSGLEEGSRVVIRDSQAPTRS
jgi:hypothetical protein